MSENYVNKLIDKDNQEHDIQDARIPQASSVDEGKALVVNAEGEFELGEGGGSDVAIASKTDIFGRMIVSDSLIEIPSTITSSSCMQDIIDLDIGIVVPDSLVSYYVKFMSGLFESWSGPAVYEIQFNIYSHQIKLIKNLNMQDHGSDKNIGRDEYVADASSGEFDLNKAFGEYAYTRQKTAEIPPAANGSSYNGKVLTVTSNGNAYWLNPAFKQAILTGSITSLKPSDVMAALNISSLGTGDHIVFSMLTGDHADATFSVLFYNGVNVVLYILLPGGDNGALHFDAYTSTLSGDEAFAQDRSKTLEFLPEIPTDAAEGTTFALKATKYHGGMKLEWVEG